MSEIEVQSSVGLVSESPRLTQWQRVANIFSAPSKTFAEIKQGRRSWWAPFLIISVTAYILFAVIFVKVGMQQVVDNQVHLNPQSEEKMAQLPADQREKMNNISKIATEVIFIATPVLTLAGFALFSLGLWGTINFVFGGKASYGSILAVFFYSTLPSIIKTLLGIVVIYAGIAPESFNIKNFAPTNIGAFLNPAETNKALYSLATSLDAVQIWSLVLLAIGTATVAGVKRSSGYIAVFGWWALFVLFGVGFAAIVG